MARSIQPSQEESPGTGRRPQSLNIDENQRTTRQVRLPLPLNTLAIPIPVFFTPDREEVEQGGEALFQYFVEEELEQHGIQEHVYVNQTIDETGDLPRAPRSVSTPDGYKNSTLAQYGSELRRLADQFSRSQENAKVREQADRVDLNAIGKEGFLSLLEALFRDGFSKERLIALFFFCLYLIMRAITEHRARLFQDLFMWSIHFIKGNVCRWVYDQGGWGRVLTKFYDIAFNAVLFSALAAVCVASCIYIGKNLK